MVGRRYWVRDILQEQGSAWQGLACSQGSGVGERTQGRGNRGAGGLRKVKM